MKIKFNGNEIEISNSSTIQDLIKEKNITSKFFAIEKNCKIIFKEDYALEKISENDSIEVVSFVGGG